MKICTFNANGIRAASRKGFWDWFMTQDIDVLCIQETKAQLDNVTGIPWPNEYHLFYADAKKAGYSGTAILTRKKPVTCESHFNYPLCDDEGRMIIAHFDDISVISAYFPSGTSGDLRQSAKYEFLSWIKEHIFDAYREKNRKIILCADVNIAHRAIDLKNDKANEKNSGYLPEERAWMDQLLSDGYFDPHRHVLGDEPAYTWWTYRQNARANNVGWRIDYQLISTELAPKVQHANSFINPIFSDHAPLIIEYDLTL